LESLRGGPAARISVIAVMTAACVSTNYLLIGVVNVKLMDLIVFFSGYAFGLPVGAAVGVLTWLVYGTINPYGFSLPILAATASGEALYGVAGALLGRAWGMEPGGGGWASGARFAVVGFLLTFAYDLYTNVVSVIVAGIPLAVGLLSGIPFALVHEASNAAFFMVGVSPLLKTVRKLSER